METAAEGTSIHILVPFSLVYMLQANKGGKDKLEKTVSICLQYYYMYIKYMALARSFIDSLVPRTYQYLYYSIKMTMSASTPHRAPVS
jgi:hypothetical protein